MRVDNVYQNCRFGILILDSATFFTFESVAEVIQKNMDRKFSKLRKSEKLDYRLQKAQIDLEFLVNFNNNSVVPKLLHSRVFENIYKKSVRKSVIEC